MNTKKLATLPLALAGLLAAFSADASVLIIGEPANGGNCFPFGCGSGSVYQQVYASSNFAGPITISDIEFFLDDGNSLNSGTFTLSLSTTSKAVDDLDTSNFANNLGADNALFGVYALAGAAPATLQFFGTPFTYNPANGNLLLDIHSTIAQPGSAFFEARNGDANGLFSRAHDFGSGFADYGLVTGFSYDEAQIPEPTTLLLCGLGLAGLAFGKRRKLS